MIREAYDAPQIVEIGAVTELTQGGNPGGCLDAPDVAACLRSFCRKLPTDPAC